MPDVRYQSNDPAALGPDERLLFEVDSPPAKKASLGNYAKRAGLILGGTVAFVVLVQCSMVAPVSDITTAVIVPIGLVVSVLSLRGATSKSPPPTAIRFTSERVLQDGPAGLRQFRPGDARHVRIARAGGHSGTSNVAGLTFDEDDVLDGDGPAATIDVDASSRRVRDAFREIVARGLGDRLATRRAARAWRSVPRLDTPACVPPIDATLARELWIAPLDGEVVLWAGRPAFSRGASIRRRLRSLRRAAPWGIGAAAAVASPFVVSWRGGSSFGPAAVIASIVGALVLLGLFFGQIVTPIQTARRLRRTQYLLTNRRVITRVGVARAMSETSLFFDDASRVALKADPDWDGVGEVTVGFHAELESIADAAAVHALAVRAVAGARAGDALPVASPAV